MEGGSAELKYRAIRLWRLRWNFGTSGVWGGKGFVKMVGTMAGTGRK